MKIQKLSYRQEKISVQEHKGGIDRWRNLVTKP